MPIIVVLTQAVAMAVALPVLVPIYVTIKWRRNALFAVRKQEESFICLLTCCEAWRLPSARTGNEAESSSALADGGGQKGLRWMSVKVAMSFLICVLLCTKLCGRVALKGGVLACGAQSETFRSFFVLLLV